MTTPRYEAQSILFSSSLSRRNIADLSLPIETNKSAVVGVWRNHAFESLIPLITPYCTFGRWHVDFRIEAYDDALTFNNWRPSDIELLWLDSSRFRLTENFNAWLDWLLDRLLVLRSMSKSPIVLATWIFDDEQNGEFQRRIDLLPGVYYSDLNRSCKNHSVELLDKRTEKLMGTPVSGIAQVILARELACHWLPAALLPPIKAIAVDLDNTLYSGILGEDGIEAVQLTSQHGELQQFLKSLQQRGVYIALVSRNEPEDVESLFSQRGDFPLRWEDFSAIEVSWGEKSTAIQRIAKTLRIAPDAILFVDDNLGELASVALQLPEVHTVYAHPDAGLTLRAIDFYPGLWRWRLESDDTRRIQDLRANSEREALAACSVSSAEYFRNLNVTLIFRHNPKEQLSRLADLCTKTNQFNLNLRRFNQSELAERLNRGNSCVTSVQLSDRLSDSGVIAVIVAERNGDQLVIEELCISCRALGRRLENTIILFALRSMPIFTGCREILFRVNRGSRNQPAIDWLKGIVNTDISLVSDSYSLVSDRLLEDFSDSGVALITG